MSLKQIKTEFLHCESGKKEAVEFLGQIKELVLKHRNSKIPLAKPKSYELRIGGLEDTVHAGDGEQLEVWKDCYLPERMEMVVIGALDDFRCSTAGWQLVLLLCEDGNVYAYEFEVLHLVARSLEDLFKSGAEFPGLEKFRFGECFEELTEEEMEKEMQCDEIKKIDDEHIQFRRRLEIEMLEDLKAIKQSETIVTELPTTKGPSSVEERTGHGRTFWAASDPTHGWRSCRVGITSHGNSWKQPGEGTSGMREQGWQGSPRGSPKNKEIGGVR
ncbi:uncharacterized protein LOC129833871 isoform X2 [Salvelinus fontinalis]|uniref:uncharacterized protein LOC129833871 isoform X2 n=1 Tax=Salvelinus fontinalis TaxID=8038 RepID=UPI00248626FB|nr:uncharacterized protein LOC129833871 isoform X2 [Salvelinus fontinalis]